MNMALKKGASKIQYTIAFLFACMVTVYIFYKRKMFLDSLREINVFWATLGLCFHYLNYYFRSLRLVQLTKHQLKLLPTAIRISSLHGFFSYFMPVRSGDLALPLLLKTFCDTKLSEGSKILIKARLLDISILGFFSVTAAILSYGQFPQSFNAIWMALGIGMMVFFYLVRKAGVFLSLHLFEYSSFFKVVCKIEPAEIIEIVETFMVWLFIGLSFYSVAQAIGLYINALEVCLLVTIQLPLQLIPFQGFANAGNHEGGWIAGLLLLGFETNEAMRFAIISHILLILYVLALVIPIVILSFVKRKKTAG